jgi:hypothetical protein
MKSQLTFRVYTRTGSKCIRKFDALEDAKSWCFVRENKYRIDWTEPAQVFGGCYVPERNNSVYVNC